MAAAQPDPWASAGGGAVLLVAAMEGWASPAWSAAKPPAAGQRGLGVPELPTGLEVLQVALLLLLARRGGGSGPPSAAEGWCSVTWNRPRL